MESKSNFQAGPGGPVQAYGPWSVVVASVVVAALGVGLLLAVAHPVPALVAGVLVLASRRSVRAVRRRLAARRRAGRRRRVCVPATDVCVEA